MSSGSVNVSKEVGFIWEIANDLRGNFKQYEFQDIILPLIVLRRLEIRLEKTRKDVKNELPDNHPVKKFNNNEQVGEIIQVRINYNNTSQYTFKKLVGMMRRTSKRISLLILMVIQRTSNIFL